ncbi:Strigolactone esterase d14 [Thalictrum thalictroides]|uniref:Strigolactone esterase d14 n=1 Tax=Thalictrum thalictroides TaxID=46969 RepID=A0A7J6XD81_THATH|nr:Strigolactone esterase d14 [Thalictrum thalictroides]
MVVLNTSLKASMNARIIGSSSGDTVILAHGFGADQSIWDKIIPSLAQSYRVLMFDWHFSAAAKDPNEFDPIKYSCLDAFAKDLIALLDEMNLTSSVFVGHSMSGMVGCLASIKRADLFKRLVLIGASPRYMNSEDYEGGFEKPLIDQIFASIESNFTEWATNFASLVVDANDPPSVQIFEKMLSKMKPEVALPMAKVVFCSDYRSSLEKVLVPCTIIQMTDDIVVPNSVVYYMQKKIKGKTTVEMIEGTGHFPQLTKNKLLVDVLDKVVSLDCEERKSI